MPKYSAIDPYSTFRSNPRMTRTLLIEQMYVRMLTEWATTRFEWKNLPEEIDARFLEMQLFHAGNVLFYYEEQFAKYMAVRATQLGRNNVYDNPTAWNTLATPGYRSRKLNLHEAVPIWGTYTRVPSIDIVLIYARRFADLDVSLEVNARNMRINRLALADENERLTVMNALKQIDEGQPAIFVQKEFELADKVTVLDMHVDPKNLEMLRLEKNQLWNECMTLLGITNTNQDKKERLVAAEAEGSDGQVLASRNSSLKPRMEAAEQINKMFDLSVDVDWAITPDEPIRHDDIELEPESDIE